MNYEGKRPFPLAIIVFMLFAIKLTAQTNVGPVRTPQINQDLYVGQSGYTTIQSAVTFACKTGNHSFRVIIPAGAAPADLPTNVTGGCSETYIADERGATQQIYNWSGSAYVLVPNGGGGGGSGVVNPGTQAQIAGYSEPGTASTVGPGSTSLNYVSPIMQSVANPSQFVTGGGNNGIINAINNGRTDIQIPTDYTTSENVPATSHRVSISDHRFGSIQNYFYNPAFDANRNWCDLGSFTGGSSNLGCHTTEMYAFGFAGNQGANYTFNYNDGGSNSYNYIPGIQSFHNRTIHANADGDAHTTTSFIFGAGNRSVSPEGVQPWAWHIDQFTHTYTATLTSATLGGTGYMQVHTTPIYGSDGLYGGGWLTSPQIDSGTFTASETVNGFSAVKTSTSHPSQVAVTYGITTTNSNGCSGFSGGNPPDPINGNACYVYTQLAAGVPPFVTGQHMCLQSGRGTEEVPILNALAASGVTQTLQINVRWPFDQNAFITSGSCIGLQWNAEKQVDGSSQTVSWPMFIMGYGPDATHYFGGNVGDGSTPATLPLAYPLSSTSRDTSGNVTAVINNNSTLNIPRINGFPLVTMSGCTNANLNFGPSAVSQRLDSTNTQVLFVQPGTGFSAISNDPSCTLTVSGLSDFVVTNVAEIQSVADPASAPQPGAEFLPLTGFMSLAYNNGWPTSAVGQTVTQPGGPRLGINNENEYTQFTSVSPGNQSSPLHFKFTGPGALGPAQFPLRFDNTNNRTIYQGSPSGGQWPVPNPIITASGPWNGLADMPAPLNGGTFIHARCPAGDNGTFACTQAFPYTVLQLDGNGSATGNMSYYPNNGSMTWNQRFVGAQLEADTVTNTQALGALSLYGAFNNGLGPAIAFGFYGDTAGIDGTQVGSRITGVAGFGASHSLQFDVSNGSGSHGTPLVLAAGGATLNTSIYAPFLAPTSTLCTDASSHIVTSGCTSATGVASINGTAGAYTFSFGTGAGSCVGTTCNFTGTGSGGAVTSVSNSDGTLTVTPTTGAVVTSLNLAHPNTWTANQTINGNLSFGAVSGHNATVNFGNNFGAPALYLFDGGAGSRLGWGIASAEMQFFVGSGNHFSFNGGGDQQTSGTNEAARICVNSSSLGTLDIGNTNCGSTAGIEVGSTEQFVVNRSTGAVTAPSVNGTTIPSSATLTQTICSGTITFTGGTAIASGANSSPVTATCTGLASTDNIQLDFNGNPLGIVGFVPSASGMLSIIKWPGANTITATEINNTSSPITPGTITLNYRVTR